MIWRRPVGEVVVAQAASRSASRAPDSTGFMADFPLFMSAVCERPA